MVEKFWRKVEIDDPHLCWEWLGCKLWNGYGRITRKYKQILAHRYAYEKVRGAIPAGSVIDHLCRNRGCVNPFHLEAVSQKENVNRGETGSHNSSKTHCSKGHEFTSENTWTNNKTNQRQCKECNRTRMREYQRSKRKEN